MKVTLLYGESDPSLVIKTTPRNKEKRAAYMRKHRTNNPELRERERKYLRNWRKQNPDKMREYQRRYRERHAREVAKHKAKYPERTKARHRSKYLPLDDKCTECNSTEKLEHHHPDYSKPNMTMTLCRGCHQKLHWGR